MIMVIANDFIKPENVEEYLVLVQELILKSRKEEGNIEYTLFRENENKEVFTLLEFWKNKESLEEHYKTKHFMALVPEIQKLQERHTEEHTYKKII